MNYDKNNDKMKIMKIAITINDDNDDDDEDDEDDDDDDDAIMQCLTSSCDNCLHQNKCTL